MSDKIQRPEPIVERKEGKNNTDTDAKKYQELVRKIRRLGHVLASLAHAAKESLKTLWMEYVKGS